MTTALTAALQLRQWVVPREKVDVPLTHVKMTGGMFARLHVPPADRAKFHYLIQHLPRECIAELHSSKLDSADSVFTRLFFDMDMPNAPGITGSDGQISYTKAMSIVSIVHQLVMRMIYNPCIDCQHEQEDDDSDFLRKASGRCPMCLRLYTDHLGLVMTPLAATTGKKVGFHLVYPWLVMSLSEASKVCRVIQEGLRDIAPYCRETSIMDTAVYRPGASLRLVNMDKPVDRGSTDPTKRYALVAALLPRGENNTDIVECLNTDIPKLFNMTCIRVDSLPDDTLRRLKALTVVTYPRSWRGALKRARSQMVDQAKQSMGVNPILPVPPDFAQALHSLALFNKLLFTGYKRLGLTSLCVYTNCRECPNVVKTQDNPKGEHHSRCLWVMVSDKECTLRCFNRKESADDLRKRVHGPCSQFRLPMGAEGPRLPADIVEKYVVARHD